MDQPKPITIDMTPTWRQLIPLLVECAANGATAEGRRTAMNELLRLADAADALNAAEGN